MKIRNALVWMVSICATNIEMRFHLIESVNVHDGALRRLSMAMGYTHARTFFNCDHFNYLECKFGCELK